MIMIMIILIINVVHSFCICELLLLFILITIFDKFYQLKSFYTVFCENYSNIIYLMFDFFHFYSVNKCCEYHKMFFEYFFFFLIPDTVVGLKIHFTGILS